MFEWITGVIERLGYTGVAVLTFVQNLFPPIPSEVVIPLAGFVAAQGQLRLEIVIVAGTVGSLMGSAMWYVVGRRVGEQRLRRWIERSGKWLTLSPNDLDRAQRWFVRWPSARPTVGDYWSVYRLAAPRSWRNCAAVRRGPYPGVSR